VGDGWQDTVSADDETVTVALALAEFPAEPLDVFSHAKKLWLVLLRSVRYESFWTSVAPVYALKK